MLKKESIILADFPLAFMFNMLGCIELLQWIWNIPKDVFRTRCELLFDDKT